MPLLDRRKSPPGGFPYREPSIGWEGPKDGSVFDERVKQIRVARANNPTAGLDPSWDACAEALDLYTCTRLKNDPKWCLVPTDPIAVAAAKSKTSVPCRGCGTPKKK